MNRWKEAAVILMAVVIALAIMMETRARNELALARAASAGNIDLALKHYSRCLTWYVPFGTAETAAEELLALGEKWSEAGRIRDAYLAIIRMRSGLYGARWLIVPRQDLLDRAEPLLARLQAQRKLGEAAEKDQIEALSKKHLALLQAPPRPSTGSALAVTLGFLAWITGGLWFISKRYGRELRPWRELLPSALLFAAGYVVWLWGMMWA
jgi:hypothetical protein